MTDIIFTNRSDEQLSEDFKALATKKLETVLKLDPTATTTEVVFTSSNNPSRGSDSHKIDVNTQGTRETYSATARASSFEQAIDEVADKLRRQLRKAKETRTVSKTGHRKPLSYGDMP